MKVLTASKPKLKPASPGPVQKLTPKQLASLVYNKVDKMYSCPFSKIINKGALTPDQIINMVRRNFVK